MMTVKVNIDPEIERQAAAVLTEIGLTISDAVRSMLILTARDKELPFNPFIPNATTIAAMEDARAGRNIKSFTSLDEMMAELNKDDDEEEEEEIAPLPSGEGLG